MAGVTQVAVFEGLNQLSRGSVLQSLSFSWTDGPLDTELHFIPAVMKSVAKALAIYVQS